MNVAQFQAFRDVDEQRAAAQAIIDSDPQNRPRLMLQHELGGMLGHAHQRSQQGDPARPLLVINRAAEDALNVQIDVIDLGNATASFGAVPQIDGHGTHEMFPSIVNSDGSVTLEHADDLAYGLFYSVVDARVRGGKNIARPAQIRELS